MVDAAHNLCIVKVLRFAQNDTLVILNGVKDLLHHIGWIGKARVVGIDAARESSLGQGHIHKLPVAVVLAGFLPHFAALLNQPHSGDVLEESSGAVYPPLVGEIQTGAL